MFSFPNAPANRRSTWVGASLAATLAWLPAQARAEAAQTDSAPSAAAAPDTASIQDVDQKVRILERKIENQEEDAKAKAAETAKFTSGPDGFVLKSADENFQLKWRGLVQVDFRAYRDEIDTGSQRQYLTRYPNNFPNTFLLRKVRPYFDVTLYKYASFRIVPDFGGGSTTLLDAYGELNFNPAARLRVGKFTAPLGLERLQSATDNWWVEYGLPANLSGNRDIGAQLSGDFLNESYSYSIGVFNGTVEGANKDNDSTNHKEIAGRIFAQPFKAGNLEIVRNFGIGIAGSWGKRWGDSINSELPVFKTPAQNTFFTYKNGARDSLVVQANGTHYSLIPQGYWFAGSFGLLAEYAFTSQDVILPRKKSPITTTLESDAWETTVSYVVTGEQPGYKSLKPRHPLALDGSGFGAIEVLARLGALDADKNNTFPVFADTTKSPHRIRSLGAGVNWYLNRSVKWTADYEWTKFYGGVAKGDRDDEDVFTTRFQFTY